MITIHVPLFTVFLSLLSLFVLGMIMSSLTSLGVQCSISGSQECPTTDGQSSNFDPLSLLRSVSSQANSLYSVFV